MQDRGILSLSNLGPEDSVFGAFRYVSSAIGRTLTDVTTPPPATPAGYYPAPEGDCLRYWDGAQWTPATQPLPKADAKRARRAKQTVTYVPRKTNHTFHLVMTVLTGGIWGVCVWLPIGIINSMSREKIVTKQR